MLSLIFLITALAVSGPSIAPPQDLPFVQPPSWTEPVEPFAIADNLYYVGTAELAAYLLTSDEGHILIDAPMQENVELILGNIRALGFEPEDIRIQLASHGHFDHTGGIAALLEATGAELVLSEHDAELVGTGGGGDFLLGDSATYPPSTATRTIEHLEQVSAGDITLTAHLTPGHTRGCTSWSGTARIEGEELSFVSICSLSVLAGYQLVGEAPSYPGIAQDYCSSLEHLESLEPDIFLGAHASFFVMHKKRDAAAGGNARAFVDQARYRGYLGRARARIEGVLSEQGQAGGCAAVHDGG